AHQGGGGSRGADAADRGPAVIKLAAPELVSPRVRTLTRSPVNSRSSSLWLTSWTGRYCQLPHLGVRGNASRGPTPAGVPRTTGWTPLADCRALDGPNNLG